MKSLIILISLLVISPIGNAWQWKDLWLNRDQQGMQLFEKKNYSEAAERFKQSNWQGASHYRAGNFEQAAKEFSNEDTASGRYNLGNALAKEGKLAEAIEAYDGALKMQPNFENAKYNRDLVSAAWKKQKESQSSKKGNKEDSKQSEQDKGADQNSTKQGEQGKGVDQNSSKQSEQGRGADQNTSKQGGQRKNADQNSTENQQSKDREKEKASPDLNDVGDINDKDNHSKGGMNNEKSPSGSKEENGDPVHAQGKELTDNKDKVQDKDQQQLQQWLQQIPDDPGGLLRRKFWRDHQRKEWIVRGNK